MMKKNILYEDSFGNVCADLEIENPEEALTKSELARQVSKLLRQRKLTPQRAAEILGIDQPKISAITRGQLCSFSIERLKHFHHKLNLYLTLSS